MVLDLFDCHRSTFCRNEPNELLGTAFADLGDPMFPEPSPEDFETRWRDAITQTIRSAGARDRFAHDKDYFRTSLHARFGQALMSRRKFRALVLPRQQGATVEEWLCPGLYFDPAELARALPVLKILLAPDWIIRAHDLVETGRVVHVVRHPQDFVQSWWSRYVTGIGGGPEKVFADNQPSLTRILRHFGKERASPAVYSLEGLVISELWRWRYVNEVMLDRFSGSSRYLKLAYERVMKDKLSWAERLFEFTGLEMTPACRSSVKKMENTLFQARKADGVDPALVEAAVEQVMGDSPWRDQLIASISARSA
jgi:hypothetical protein